MAVATALAVTLLIPQRELLTLAVVEVVAQVQLHLERVQPAAAESL